MPKVQLKLIAALAALAAVVALFTGWLAEGRLRERELARIEASLRTRTLQLVEQLGPTPLVPEASDALSRRARAASRVAGARVTFMGDDGTVVADSDVPRDELAAIENHKRRPEMRAALRGEHALARRLSATVERRLLYSAAPGQAGGVVRLALDLSDIDAAVADLRRQLVLATGLGVVFAAVLAVGVSALVLRPLGPMRRVLESLAAGNLGARVTYDAQDELGEMARAINRLGDELGRDVEALSAEKEQLHAVLSTMLEGVLIVDASGEIALANPRLRELLGLPGPLEGRKPAEAIRNAAVQDALARAAREPAPVTCELELPGRSLDARRVLHMNAARFRAPGGPGVAAVFHDMTELRRLEAVRRDFVANASHELKTPLTAIRGFAETLLGGNPGAPERRDYLQVIADHAQRMGALVDDLLALSRLDAGAEPLQLEPVDVGSVVRQVLGAAQPRLDAAGVTASCADDPAPRVRADRRALEQVLQNLLENAAKYTERGGRVDVRWRESGPDVRVEVRDSGLGIPAVDRERIFERFYRVDRARSRDRGGTGLGLSIVKHLVESMGGVVRVDSTPGEGSTFWFTLPQATR